jgi:hypothetical protein
MFFKYYFFLQCVLAGTSTGSVMVYHLKNLPTATTVCIFVLNILNYKKKIFKASELMDIIEQQTHHLPPSEDTTSSVTSVVAAKENVTPT